MKISLLNLKRQYKYLKEDIEKNISEILEGGAYINGPQTKKFEKKMEEYLGVKHAIGIGNGTDALVIALEALGIGRGDEVITSPFTFFATAEAISVVGAVPVFVDVKVEDFNIDENKIEKAITSKTKAIMPVHIFGTPANMDKINEIAKKNNLYVIEDACQAIGAKYKDKMIGSLSDIACFSFFPTKNLGTYGDGGLIATNNDNLATICRALKAHGSGENGEIAYNLLNNIEEEVKVDNQVDDTVYGGGSGMVIMVEPVVLAIESVKTKDSKIIFLTPSGDVYNQDKAISLSKEKHLIIICGHYEGIDERIKHFIDMEISIGDFVLTGGEIPSMVLVDSITRLLDGVITKESLESESFNDNLLDYAVYTKPRNFRGYEVPEVLVSGNHELIRKYREEERIRRTNERRKDLIDNVK